mgnify:CR=1 FL=1
MTALPKILFVLLLACAGLPVASAANAPADDVAVKELANGLRVIVKPDRRAPVVVSMVWYRIGSVDEQGGITGVAHVLEHMMFKGTKAVPAGEFSRLIAAAGGRENAFTSRDYTGYFQTLHKSALPLSFRLEADRMANLVLSPEAIANELARIARHPYVAGRAPATRSSPPFRRAPTSPPWPVASRR